MTSSPYTSGFGTHFSTMAGYVHLYLPIPNTSPLCLMDTKDWLLPGENIYQLAESVRVLGA